MRFDGKIMSPTKAKGDHGDGEMYGQRGAAASNPAGYGEPQAGWEADNTKDSAAASDATDAAAHTKRPMRPICCRLSNGCAAKWSFCSHARR